jgi:hypothetical protein
MESDRSLELENIIEAVIIILCSLNKAHRNSSIVPLDIEKKVIKTVLEVASCKVLHIEVIYCLFRFGNA